MLFRSSSPQPPPHSDPTLRPAHVLIAQVQLPSAQARVHPAEVHVHRRQLLPPGRVWVLWLLGVKEMRARGGEKGGTNVWVSCPFRV